MYLKIFPSGVIIFLFFNFDTFAFIKIYVLLNTGVSILISEKIIF